MTKVSKSQSFQKQVTYYHGSEFLQTFAENHNHIHLKHLKVLGETAHQMYQKSLKCYLYNPLSDLHLYIQKLRTLTIERSNLVQ